MMITERLFQSLKTLGMKQKILERFVLGEPERIQSKLSAEPILRMHTLSLIASNFCNSMDQLLDFYSKTFYAYQYGDMGEVEQTIKDVVSELVEYGFLYEDEIAATKVGKRVSELYIDPDSAHLMIQSLKKADKKNMLKQYLTFSCFHAQLKMQPRPRVKR